MRIALIASGFADYSIELAGALAHDHAVLALADEKALARERGSVATPPGVEMRRFSQCSLLRRWGSIAPLAATLARWRPDAILAHEHPHPHLTLLLRLARYIAPLGLIVHDPEPHPGRDGAFALDRAHDIKLQRALANQLFAHGRGCSAALAATVARPVIPLVHGPILRPSGLQLAPPGKRGVLMFGRMERYKGLEVLLQAAQRLRADGVEHSLQVCGAGPELDRLKSAFEALPACTVVPGHASRETLLQALAACDVVVAPYLQASASGVAAAALANGRGVVASEIGGLSEAIWPGVNGVLTAAGDPDALADGLRQALSLAEQLGRGALELANGPFAWRHAAASISTSFDRRAWAA